MRSPLLALACLWAAGCGQSSAPPTANRPVAPTTAPTNIATAGAKVGSVVSLKWVGCGVTKKAFMEELAKGYEQQAGVKISLDGGGATRGIRDVDAGAADLGGSCRHALDVPEESDVVFLPIAWDALVVVVHKDNPLNEIRRDQVGDVFTGKITSWAQLNPDADDIPIHAHVREGKISGVGYMERLLMYYDPELDYSQHCSAHASTGPLEAALQKDPNGIAITGISSAARQPGLKILALDGVQPSVENLINGSYEFIRPLYLTVHKDHRDIGPAADFVKFALSAKGQQIIASTGTVPMAKIGSELFDRFYAKLEKAHLKVAKLQADRRAMEAMVDLSLEELGKINVIEIKAGN